MKIFISEYYDKKFFSDYEKIITPRYVEFNDRNAWLKLMEDNLSDSKTLIVYPEAYLNIVDQEELLLKWLETIDIKCSFFTQSPYMINGDEFDKYIVPIFIENNESEEI